MEINAQEELRANVETLASDSGESPAAIITKLQSAAAATGNEILLDELCTLKMKYLNQA